MKQHGIIQYSTVVQQYLVLCDHAVMRSIICVLAGARLSHNHARDGTQDLFKLRRPANLKRYIELLHDDLVGRILL